MSGHSNLIKSFDTIRPSLRAALAGLALGGAPPETGRDRALWMRLRHFVPDERRYNARKDGRRTIRTLSTDAWRNSNNYLIALYRAKTYTPRRLAILLLVLQLIGAAPGGISMAALIKRIVDLIPAQPLDSPSKDEDGSKTVRALCSTLIRLGTMQMQGSQSRRVYVLAPDVLGGLAPDERTALLYAIGFAKNVLPLGAYGYFLESALKSRYALGRLPHIPAQFLHAGMTRLIDEEIVQRALDAHEDERLLLVTYLERDAAGAWQPRTYHIAPLRIEEDAWQGNRQTLVGVLCEPLPAGARRSDAGGAAGRENADGAADAPVWWDRLTYFPLDRVTDAVLGAPQPGGRPDAAARPPARMRLRVYGGRKTYARIRRDLDERYAIVDERMDASPDPARDADPGGSTPPARDIVIEAADPYALIPFVQERAPALAIIEGPAAVKRQLRENLAAAIAAYEKLDATERKDRHARREERRK